MFGLGQEKKKGGEEFIFELESEFRDPKKHKEIKAKVESRIEELKKLLREGEKQKEFERLGLILHGYNALLKVMSRVPPK